MRALFLETSCFPIRLIYSRSSDSSPGDFYELVEEDNEMLGLNLTDLDIGKAKVKSHVNQAAFCYLKSLKLNYSKFEKAAYVNCEGHSN